MVLQHAPLISITKNIPIRNPAMSSNSAAYTHHSSNTWALKLVASERTSGIMQTSHAQLHVTHGTSTPASLTCYQQTQPVAAQSPLDDET
mmetsp:Transcript_33974/g.75324  ORF Transcript_33974/g.75324 Transcript_33974/m.75324 type:complete len:90 (-) Transcript_33974:213-482(-)